MQYQYYTLRKGTVHNQQHKGIVQLLTDRVYWCIYKLTVNCGTINNKQQKEDVLEIFGLATRLICTCPGAVRSTIKGAGKSKIHTNWKKSPLLPKWHFNKWQEKTMWNALYNKLFFPTTIHNNSSTSMDYSIRFIRYRLEKNK